MQTARELIDELAALEAGINRWRSDIDQLGAMLESRLEELTKFSHRHRRIMASLEAYIESLADPSEAWKRPLTAEDE